MYKVTRATTADLNQEGKSGAALPRLAVAFFIGMLITAALAYLPVITGVFTPIFNHEHTAPAPSYTPPGDNTDGSLPTQKNIHAPVYAPHIEGAFSV